MARATTTKMRNKFNKNDRNKTYARLQLRPMCAHMARAATNGTNRTLQRQRKTVRPNQYDNVCKAHLAERHTSIEAIQPISKRALAARSCSVHKPNRSQPNVYPLRSRLPVNYTVSRSANIIGECCAAPRALSLGPNVGPERWAERSLGYVLNESSPIVP